MSEATPGREWRFYVEDMVRFCDRVLAYTAGMEQQAWLADDMRFDATLRNLELIGEAATHVPPDVRSRAPAIPWRQIVATRNRLIHAYLGLDPETIWSIVRDDLPALRHALLQLRAQESGSG